MKRFAMALILIFSIVPLSIGNEIFESQLKRPPHTYSIVARNPDTGQLGVAVQSHWFSVWDPLFLG